MIFFGFLCEIFFIFLRNLFDISLKFFEVTRLERPKEVKDKVKQARKAQSRPGVGGPGVLAGGLEVGALDFMSYMLGRRTTSAVIWR